MNLWFTGILGAIFGSFANAYFYRMAEGLSLVRPRSFCPSCSKTIFWYDNIPVLSFVLLRGKCRNCSAPISIQYPLVEIACTVLFVCVAVHFRGFPWFAVAAYLAFSFLIFLIGGIDLATFFKLDRQYGIIPDHLSYSLIALGILSSPFNPAFAGGFWLSAAWAMGAAAILLAFRWIAGVILKRESLGLGDVKMLAGVAAMLGGNGFFWTLLIGSTVGSVLSLSLIWAKKMDRKSSVPFGPFLALGALCAVFIS